MTEVVRDGSSSTADSSELLASKELLLGSFQVGPHSTESGRQFCNFIACTLYERISEITLFKSPDAGEKIGQGLREGVGDKKNSSAACQHRHQAQGKKRAVQTFQESR